MGEWEHKEETYRQGYLIQQGTAVHAGQFVMVRGKLEWVTKTKLRRPSSIRDLREWRGKELSLSEWLDAHCKGGWEVLKIWHIQPTSDDEYDDSGVSQTRCIFRRRSE